MEKETVASFQGSRTRNKNRTIPFKEEDMRQIEWMAATLGCSKSEAIRTAIRFYAAQLAVLDRKITGAH